MLKIALFGITGFIPVSTTNKEFSENLALAFGWKHLYFLREFVLKVFFGEGSDILLKSQNVIPQKLVKQGFNFIFRIFVVL